MTQLHRHSRAVLGGLLDLALPKRCVQCGVAGAWLCPDCAAGLRPLPAERCRHCGAPAAPAPGAAGPAAASPAPAAPAPLILTCRECRGRQLWFYSAAAGFTYEGPARALVTACKFRAYRSLTSELARLAGPAFVQACAAAGFSAAAPAGEQLVTWVPGHRDHTLERGFNQAELLACGLAGHAGLQAAPLLRRVRHGARQSGLGRAARAANVHQSFALREDSDRVRSKLRRIMIVDDVYTTGETLNHCAEVLVNAGLEPHVFAFARTVRAVPSQPSLDAAVRKERCR